VDEKQGNLHKEALAVNGLDDAVPATPNCPLYHKPKSSFGTEFRWPKPKNFDHFKGISEHSSVWV
jgi:hypothetical protein